MRNTNLSTGVKEELLIVFNKLKKIHGRDWLSLLRKRNQWYDTSQGINAWENAGKRKSCVGNEALRLIIADMQAIVSNQRTKTTLQRHGLTRRAKA